MSLCSWRNSLVALFAATMSATLTCCSVRSVALADEPATTDDPSVIAAEPHVERIWSNGSDLFWSPGRYMPGLLGCAKTDCAKTVVEYTNDLGPTVVSSQSRVYFVEWYPKPTLYSCPLSGCGAERTRIFMDVDLASAGLAVDDSFVYWLSSSLDEVYRCPASGCGPVPENLAEVYGMFAPFPQLVLAGDSMFFANSSGIIQQARKDGLSSPVAFATQPEAIRLGEMAASSDMLYWTNYRNELMSCPLTGCGAGPRTVASSSPSPRTHLAADDSGVYWLESSVAPTSGEFAARMRVLGCPPAGCGAAPAQLTPEGVLTYVVDRDDVFWVEVNTSTPGVGRYIHRTPRPAL